MIHRSVSPAVGIGLAAPIAHGYHRLYGYGHSRAQAQAVTGLAKVGYRRILMHLPAYAVAAHVADDSVSMSLSMGLHGACDIAKPVAHARGFERAPEALLGNLNKLPFGVVDLTNADRERAIRLPAPINESAIDREYLSFFQRLVVGEAVNYHVVHRAAQREGIRAVQPFHTKERRLCAHLGYQLVRQLIQMKRGDSGAYLLPKLAEHVIEHAAGHSHLFYLRFIFQRYHCCCPKARIINENTVSRGCAPSTSWSRPFCL